MGNYPDSLNFIFDTGRSSISLDSATAADLKIPVIPSDVTVNGIAGRSKVGFIYDQQLRLPGLDIDSLDFHAADYELMTSFYGEKINGIIGYTVLKNYVVELDSDSSIISFYSKGSLKYPRGGYLLKPNINFQPFQHASLKDAMAKVLMRDLDASIKMRMPMCKWKQWKNIATRRRNLLKLGVSSRDAYSWSKSSKGYCRVAHSYIICQSMTASLL